MLTYHSSPYSLVLILLAASIALFAFTRWRLRAMRPTAATGALLLWCGSLWILTNALEIASANLQTVLFWYKIEYFAIAPIPLLWLFMALQFTGADQRLTPKRLLALAMISLISVLLLLSNDWHGLFVSNMRLEFADSVTNLVLDPGPAMVVFYLYGYIIIILGTYLLTQKLLHSRGFRWQGSMVLLGVFLSVGAHILDWSHLNPIPSIKLTPLALFISIPFFVITLQRARRADILPIARSSIIQIMQDAVLVLDVEHHIIDLNPAAEAIMGRPLATVVGKIIHEVWPEAAGQIAAPADKPGDRSELRLGEGNQTRIFDSRRSELTDWRGHRISQVVVLRDVTVRAQAEELVQASLQEKEVLLKEIHHRVKNNLQIIASLLNLQSNAIDDPRTRAQFADSQNRIRSMALIHERLYRSDDLARIEFGAYLRDLAASLVQTYRGQAQSIRLQVEADPILLDIDTAIPCGLLVNELVSNALKHAFPNGRAGMLGVELCQNAANRYRLAVWDDGVGIPATVDIQHTASLGLQLVNSLTKQIGGQVEMNRNSGTAFVILFPKQSPKEH